VPEGSVLFIEQDLDFIATGGHGEIDEPVGIEIGCGNGRQCPTGPVGRSSEK